MSGPEIKSIHEALAQDDENLIDIVEAKEMHNYLKNAKQEEFDAFFKDEKNNKIYNDFLDKITNGITRIELGNKSFNGNADKINEGVDLVKNIKEKLAQEKNRVSSGVNKPASTPNGSKETLPPTTIDSKATTDFGRNIDAQYVGKPEYEKMKTLLAKENMSLGVVFESINTQNRSLILKSILTELLKNNVFTKGKGEKKELNDMGKNIYKNIEGSFSKDNRTENLSFVIFEKIIQQLKQKTNTGNQEKDLEAKIQLLTTLKTSNNQGFAKGGNILGLFNSLYPDMKNVTEGLKTTIMQEIGDPKKLDITSKPEAITIISGKVENVASVLGNYTSAKALIESYNTKKTIDIATLPRDVAQPEATKDMKPIMDTMNDILQDIPAEGSAERAFLEKKGITKKIDGIINKYGSGTINMIMDFLKKILGEDTFRAIAKFAFPSLTDEQFEQAMNRPKTRQSVDTYTRLLGNKNQADKYSWIKIDNSDKTEIHDIKTNYYKTSINNVALSINKDGSLSYNNIDKDGQPTQVSPEENKKLDENFSKGVVEKDTKKASKEKLANAIMFDIRPDMIKLVLMNHFSKPSADGKTVEPPKGDELTIIENMCKEKYLKERVISMLKENPYIYSTQDIIATIVEEATSNVANKIVPAQAEVPPPAVATKEKSSSNPAVVTPEKAAEKPERHVRAEAWAKKNTKGGQVYPSKLYTNASYVDYSVKGKKMTPKMFYGPDSKKINATPTKPAGKKKPVDGEDEGN